MRETLVGGEERVGCPREKSEGEIVRAKKILSSSSSKEKFDRVVGRSNFSLHRRFILIYSSLLLFFFFLQINYNNRITIYPRNETSGNPAKISPSKRFNIRSI